MGVESDAAGVIEPGSWPIPDRVDVDQGRVLWNRGPQTAELRPGALDELLALPPLPSPDEVVTLVRSWGPLLAEPDDDRRAGVLDHDGRRCGQCRGRQRGTLPAGIVLHGAEPVIRWGMVASDARALIRAGVALRRSESALDHLAALTVVQLDRWEGGWMATSTTGSWTDGHQPGTLAGSTKGSVSLDSERRLVGEVLSWWWQVAGVALVPSWPATGPRLLVRPANAMGGFGVQLQEIVMGARRLAVCAACGAPYSPSYRQPRAGEKAYCDRPECKRTGARERQRRHRGS